MGVEPVQSPRVGAHHAELLYTGSRGKRVDTMGTASSPLREGWCSFWGLARCRRHGSMTSTRSPTSTSWRCRRRSGVPQHRVGRAGLDEPSAIGIMKFSAWFWFLGIWLIVVLPPIAHWAFSPAGRPFRAGPLDFAGGTVVHINAGIAALAVVLVIGRRRGWPQHPMPPHSLPLTLLGTGILVVRLVRLQRPARPRRPASPLPATAR